MVGLKISAMSEMNYRVTILNISAAAFLSGIIIHTILNYKTLAEREGLGIIAMFGPAVIAIVIGLSIAILSS